MSVAVILGSAFGEPVLGTAALEPQGVSTRFGAVTLYRLPERSDAFVLFRHGAPHRRLPNQIPYRAHAAALAAVGVRSLLVTSSVGVMDPAVPLFEPTLVTDLLMLDNRLPNGSQCSMWPEPHPDHGHLVVEGGLFNAALDGQVRPWLGEKGRELGGLVFAYVPGPRTKTPFENRYLAGLGAQVNSMSLGPEVVLANELEIATAAVVVGHKYSSPHIDVELDQASIRQSLERSQRATEALALRFLREARPVPFANRIYRFGSVADDH